MRSTEADNAAAWGLAGVLDYYDHARATFDDIYPSERFFLGDRLRDGISVLDIGCAQGGFAAVLREKLADFRYVGLDVNAGMIERARAKFPEHEFHDVDGCDYSILGSETFDLVLVLGILHLHETWRDTLGAAWRRTRGSLVADLREHEGSTLEDKATSFFRMDFGGGDEMHADTHLPYIIVNSAEALDTVKRTCAGAARINHFGYLHPVSASAVSPVEEVMAATWCIER